MITTMPYKSAKQLLIQIYWLTINMKNQHSKMFPEQSLDVYLKSQTDILMKCDTIYSWLLHLNHRNVRWFIWQSNVLKKCDLYDFNNFCVLETISTYDDCRTQKKFLIFHILKERDVTHLFA